MEDVTANAETLMYQAVSTSEIWLRKIVTILDDMFGEGYAEDHPTLVSGMLTAAALDQHAAHVRIAGQDIREGLYSIGRVIRDLDTLPED